MKNCSAKLTKKQSSAVSESISSLWSGCQTTRKTLSFAENTRSPSRQLLPESQRNFARPEPSNRSRFLSLSQSEARRCASRDKGRSTSSASSLKENFHGNVCSIPSRYLCLFLAQPQCPATHDGPCLHAVSTACDQGEQHDSSPDSAVQRASAQSVRREDVVAAGGQEVIPCPPINIGADGILRTLPFSLTDQKHRNDLYRRRKQLEALSSRQQNSLNSASGHGNLVSCAKRKRRS